MNIIKCTGWVSYRGFLLIIEPPHDYKIGDKILICDGDSLVLETEVFAIDEVIYDRANNKFDIALVVKGLSKEDWINKKVCAGMQVKRS